MQNMIELRARAERAVRATLRDVSALANRDVKGLIHDFQVQEVALEMQNESLELAQRELEKCREQYEDLHDFAPVGYLTIDTNGVIVRVNAAALTMLATTRASLLDKPLATFVAHEDLQLLNTHLQLARSDPRSRAFGDLHLSRPDGSTLRVRLDLSPAPSGERESFIVLTDVSEPKRTADELSHLNNELEGRVAVRTAELETRNHDLESEIQARIRSEQHERELEARLHDAERMQSLGVLASGIAHDFNNLLVSVLGNAELLLHSANVSEDLRGPLTLIERAALNASDLTRQLLVYAGHGHATMGPVHVPRVIKESVELVRNTAPSGIDLQVQMSGDLPLVDADRGQVQQIVLNLVGNAIEALGERGTIVIRARSGPLDADALAKFSHARTAVPGEFVVFQVQDNGTGIDASKLPHIFDPFFTTKFAGRGLGLGSVLGIVQSHCGALRVQSSAREGTSFEIALPHARASRDSDSAPPISEANWKGSGPALVIDDDGDVRKVLVQMLELLGFEVEAANGGEQGLALLGAANPPFELVLLDWMMPGVSGEQVLRSLRAKDEVPAVVLVSGLRAESLASGDDPRLVSVQKPMTLADLRTAVRTVTSPLYSLSHGSPAP
jgi:PAS domain S-box-containing protein